jgi:hypothetical protein
VPLREGRYISGGAPNMFMVMPLTFERMSGR